MQNVWKRGEARINFSKQGKELGLILNFSLTLLFSFLVIISILFDFKTSICRYILFFSIQYSIVSLIILKLSISDLKDQSEEEEKRVKYFQKEISDIKTILENSLH